MPIQSSRKPSQAAPTQHKPKASRNFKGGKVDRVSALPKGNLKEAMAALRKNLGNVPLFLPPTRRYIPMRHQALARMLGGENTPGLPSGVYIEVVGNASAGKTTTIMAFIEAVINQPPGTTMKIRSPKGIVDIPAGRRTLVLDFEHTIDIDYMNGAIPGAVLLNVADDGSFVNEDTANIWLHQPGTGEEGLEVACQLAACGAFDLIVVDSIPAMLPQAVRDRSMTEPTVGKHAAMMAVFFQRLTALIAERNVTVVLVNQWRDVIGARPFQPQRRTPGGRAMEFFDSIKLDISGPKKTQWFPDGGKVANIRTLKNKVTGLDGQVATYHIGVGFGLSAEVELTESLLELGLVTFGRTYNDCVTRLQGTKSEKSYANRYEWLVALRNSPKLYNGMADLLHKQGVKIGTLVAPGQALGD